MFRPLQSCDDADAEVASSSLPAFVPDSYDPPLPQAARRRNWSGAFDAATRSQLEQSIASGAGANLVLASAGGSASSDAPRANDSAIFNAAVLIALVWLATR